jgi:NADH:ubiquinone oxidoreductase subunit E
LKHKSSIIKFTNDIQKEAKNLIEKIKTEKEQQKIIDYLKKAVEIENQANE